VNSTCCGSKAFDQAWGWREQWLVVEGEQVLGFCSLSQDRQALYIRELHLLPEHPGVGGGGGCWRRWQPARGSGIANVAFDGVQGQPGATTVSTPGFLEAGRMSAFVQMQQ
jgi:hypothetical protein